MLGPKIGERVTDYLQRQIDADRIFIGCEGDEPSLAYAVGVLGNKPFLYSSDFPHEVTRDSCIEELNELQGNKELTNADKEAILHKNAQRFYGI
jgi:predicted TIM-barrel fold metal-dependent hydrolase